MNAKLHNQLITKHAYNTTSQNKYYKKTQQHTGTLACNSENIMNMLFSS